jgi:HAD superfamily hydrolase (TIGR01509 family)
MTQKAVIFDMDGVIIDSEGLWKQAEKEVFSSLGVQLTEEHCAITQSMTTTEVTQFWFARYPWQNATPDTVEQMVISRVIELINNENCAIHGVKRFIEKLKAKNYKIGLATNSPNRVIPAVLQKSGTLHLFDTVSSAEFETNGKPDPAVYLTTAAKLNVAATDCIAIEDSHSGMLAANQAGMRVIAFTNGNSAAQADLATYKFDHFDNFDMDRLN